ncbi:TPA: Galactose oxidase, central domain [Trebouxia sp. C0005]
MMAQRALGSHLSMPGRQGLSVQDLATNDLRSLATLHGKQNAGSCDHNSLLAFIEDNAYDTSKHWHVQDIKGVSPARVNAQLLSNNGDLYMYGGRPAELDLLEELDQPVFSNNKEPFFMKLDKETDQWTSLTYSGASADWDKPHCLSAGLVHQDSFYLVGGTTDPDMNPNSRDDVRILDFATQRWTLVTTDVRPRGRVDQFLIGCGDQLIQFGGYDSAAHEFVEASEALWTFDTKSHRWQQQHPSGPLPVPYLARGLAHFNGRAFLLADDPTMQMGMEVYELDVQDWQWRLLPCHGPAPSCRDRLTSVVFQEKWLVYGGLTSAFEMPSGMSTFDFATLTWSRAELMGAPLPARMAHMATVHEGAMVIMGGLQPGPGGVVPAETVQCIRPMPSWTGRSDVRPKRYDRVASAMFKRQPEANDRLAVKTDDTITVQGQVFPVHRVMLALVSTVFDAAFQCDLEEGKTSYELDLSHEDTYGLTAETMSLLLDWVYDELNVDLTLPQTVSLFVASHMLDVTDLHLQCEHVLKTFITVDTFFQLSDLAETYCIGGALAQACGAFYQQHRAPLEAAQHHHTVNSLRAQACRVEDHIQQLTADLIQMQNQLAAATQASQLAEEVLAGALIGTSSSDNSDLKDTGRGTAADEDVGSDGNSDADVFDLEYYEDEYESDEEEVCDLEGVPLTIAPSPASHLFGDNFDLEEASGTPTSSPAAQPLDPNLDHTHTHVTGSSPGVNAVYQETRGAASASPPPLSMTQQALVGAGLVAFGGLLAATATVIVGAAAVKMLPIPRPRFPSFALW